MLSTGVERPVDELGRIVIPKEIRRNFNIETGNRLAISIDGNKIILTKSVLACALCGGHENIEHIGEHTLCEHCIKKVKEH
ncbi:MAG: AbrB/MazE/SpoVT family DNA-binding domain-containing protein [Acutalibacteraceae bacterium]|nr:AbrB/MazE/SpoVT family DNA-binding domain-containing protein [Clostridia bacterium]MEE1144012.1 AbrB/MazE/SpoVT family DNA-binding domain-containing protein [Acutalibacteraceae bacterium]